MRKLSFLFAAIPFMIWGGTIHTNHQDPETKLRPWDLQLEGTIGKDIGVTFLLNKIGAENVAFSSECFEVRGHYMYKNYLKRMEVEGKVCPEENTFEMWYDKGGEAEEHFIGGLSGFLRDWDGQWEQPYSGKKLKLSLRETEFIADEKDRMAFMEKINEDLADGGYAENMNIEEAGFDDIGAHMTGVEFPWGGEVEFFSGTRLEYYTSYTSTARSSFNRYIYQLMKKERNLYLTWLHYNSDYDKTENTEFSGYEIQIFEWKKGSWEIVTEEILPKGFPDTQMFESEVNIEAEITYDRLRLDYRKEKRLFKWNGQTFYR